MTIDITGLPDFRRIRIEWTYTETFNFSTAVTVGALRELLAATTSEPDGDSTTHLAEGDWEDVLEDVLDDYEADNTHEHPSVQERTGLTVRLLKDRRVAHTVSVTTGKEGDATMLVLAARTPEQAARFARRHHADALGVPEGDVTVVEGRYDTFEGVPSWPSDFPRAPWSDLRGEPSDALYARELAEVGAR